MNIINLSEQNSLLSQFVSEIRNIHVQNDRLRFRRNIERIGELIAYEISKTFTYKPVDIETPLGIATANLFTEKVVLATILRAGLPFHQGFLNYLDCSENAFVSAYRKYKENSEQFNVYIEYIASPRLEDKELILIDPMLATGSSMELAYHALMTKGVPENIHIASIIASQQAVDYCANKFPDNTTIWVAAIDPELNSHAYIIPGLGDVGDLSYGPKD